MSVIVRVVIVDKSSNVPCVKRKTYLEFSDAPGLPESVTDDAGNTYTLLSGKPAYPIGPVAEATWHTLAVHMPSHITLKYPGATDGFSVPRDLPRLGSTRG